MNLATAILCGFLLDLLLADPAWMPHPVVLMGKAITALERFLRRRFPPIARWELFGGCLLAAILPLGTLLFTGGVCLLAAWLHPALGWIIQTVWCW